MSGFVRSNVVRKATVIKSGQSSNESVNEQVNEPTTQSVAKPVINLPISGSRSWLHGLSYASSGCVDLDSLCSGGMFVNSLVCLLEDSQSYHRYFTRMFVADGLAYKHRVLVVSTRSSHSHITSNLPVQSSSKQIPTSQMTNQSVTASSGPVKNEFRSYDSKSNMSSSDRSSKASVTLSKSYDWSRTVNQSNNEEIHHLSATHQSGNQSVYVSTLKQIAVYLHAAQQSALKAGTRNLTRVLVESVGDLEWGYQSSEQAREMLLFVAGLRFLISRFDALCVLTFPSSMYASSISQTILRSCQYGFEFRPLPLASPYRDHDALLYVHAMHPGHSLAQFSDHKEWLVALRKRVTIEKVSLPPELARDEGSQHSQRAAQVSQITSVARGHIAMEQDDNVEVKPKAPRTSRVGCGSGKGDGTSKFDF